MSLYMYSKKNPFYQIICWSRLGWYDILSRYRQTRLGPFWIVILTGVIVFSLGMVYGSLFSMPIVDFLPYVAIGYILWGWFSTTLIEAGSSFQSYKQLLLNHRISPHLIIVRVLVRNILILFHNMVVVVLMFLFFKKDVSSNLLLIIPSFLLISIFLFSLSTFVALICSRFKDFSQVISALLSVGMLITPVVWSADILGERRYIAEVNPFTHLIALVREPLLGNLPTPRNWGVVIILTVVLSAISLVSFKKYRHKLLFWI